MPTTTGYEFGDVVLVPLPFTDQTGTKQRPAVVISSAVLNRERRDLINQLKAFASARDVPYQALIKLLLAESLAKRRAA